MKKRQTNRALALDCFLSHDVILSEHEAIPLCGRAERKSKDLCILRLS
jgi:hypothetical protein